MWKVSSEAWELEELFKDQLKKMLRKASTWKIQNMKSFLWNLRTKLNVMTTLRKASWKRMIYKKKCRRFFRFRNTVWKDSSDSETQFEISRQNQPDAVDETQPLEGCFINVKSFFWSLRTRRTPQRSACEDAEEGFEMEDSEYENFPFKFKNKVSF